LLEGGKPSYGRGMPPLNQAMGGLAPP